MPTNQQRREAAKRKLERQLANRAERAKKRRIWTAGITIGAVVVVAGLITLLVVLNSGGSSTPAAQPSDASTPPSTPQAPPLTNGPCKYTTASSPAAKQVAPPPDVDPTPNTGTAKVLLKTNQGDIPVTIDRSKAPCTAQAIEHLVKSKYYDGVPCHRLTGGDSLKVLQCGDPSGQGNGGPGFEIKDELPTGLKPDPTGQAVIYPRGALAMANSGPNTNGSQFFLVYGDSTLGPNYTLFGNVDPAGLTTIDKIAAGGITPGQNGPTDGAPKNPVTITTATES
ncbi:peptidylprolyl isomerase [Actinocrispum wychmicini]|uniref:Peptidyl-prolyl cis-trans isomerase B (Cyclophilin B) n=1 Tax=Actinocrispum wychmicini TaxID=1213861 RepID=A0A4R2J0R9_9PSEU|nr:peptidylprolyl isomerase [Actinocrispum wychmicini]TCO49839.1 peptidyl-prolyl cis-trans isomerase B (cyclophilin B) [Actinocrispum wychmicini]